MSLTITSRRQKCTGRDEQNGIWNQKVVALVAACVCVCESVAVVMSCLVCWQFEEFRKSRWEKKTSLTPRFNLRFSFFRSSSRWDDLCGIRETLSFNALALSSNCTGLIDWLTHTHTKLSPNAIVMRHTKTSGSSRPTAAASLTTWNVIDMRCKRKEPSNCNNPIRKSHIIPSSCYHSIAIGALSDSDRVCIHVPSLLSRDDDFLIALCLCLCVSLHNVRLLPIPHPPSCLHSPIDFSSKRKTKNGKVFLHVKVADGRTKAETQNRYGHLVFGLINVINLLAFD